MLKLFGKTTLVVIGLGLAGCASGLPRGHQADYANLPGVNDAAKGPGLLSMGHYDPSDGGGTVIFSTDAQKSAFIHPKDVNGGSPDRHSETVTNNIGAAGASTSPSTSAVSATSTSGSSDAGAAEHLHSYQQFKSYQRFKDFEEFQQFLRLPADAPERRRFERWQNWQQNRR